MPPKTTTKWKHAVHQDETFVELSKFALPPWSSSAVKPTHTQVTSNLTCHIKEGKNREQSRRKNQGELPMP
jgi:hypothetical protein